MGEQMQAGRAAEQRLVWAHNYLANALEKVGKMLPGFPQRTIIVRDSSNPECYIVLTNETDAVADRLHAALAAVGATSAQKVEG